MAKCASGCSIEHDFLNSIHIIWSFKTDLILMLWKKQRPIMKMKDFLNKDDFWRQVVLSGENNQNLILIFSSHANTKWCNSWVWREVIVHRSWQPLLGPKKSPSLSIYIGPKVLIVAT